MCYLYMPKLSKEDIKKLADLSRIELTENEYVELAESLPKILDYMSILDEADTSNISDNAKVIDGGIVFRDDEANSVFIENEKLESRDLTKATPGKLKGGFYELPSSHN